MKLHRKSHNFPRPLLLDAVFGEREFGIDFSYQGAIALTISLSSETSGEIPEVEVHALTFMQHVRNPRSKPVVAKVSASTSTSGISPDVSELIDIVKALLLDKKNQSQTPAHQTTASVKAVEESCVTCGGAHSYQSCPATDGNIYHDNIQAYVSQAAAANFNQGSTSARPPMVANQIRPPAYQAPVYQAPAPQTQGVSKTDFDSYVKANDAVMRNVQNQGQNLQAQLNNLATSNQRLESITTPNGVAYQGPAIPSTSSSSPKVMNCDTKVTKDTMLPTNNGSIKDIQPPVIQVQSQNPTFEPVVDPVIASKS
ncbi:hypothetical protein Tco_1391796 [Tanacetum coccineum]